MLQDFSHANSSAEKRVDGDRILSDRSRQLLCEALRDEIQQYEAILHQAANLNDEDVQSSLPDLKTCSLLKE